MTVVKCSQSSRYTVCYYAAVGYSVNSTSTSRRVLDHVHHRAASENIFQMFSALSISHVLEDFAGQVRANEEVIAQQKSRISEMESSNRQLESRCQDLCKVADSHESRVLELTKECQKTGQIIQKLAVSVHSSKSLYVDYHVQQATLKIDIFFLNSTGSAYSNNLCALTE